MRAVAAARAAMVMIEAVDGASDCGSEMCSEQSTKASSSVMSETSRPGSPPSAAKASTTPDVQPPPSPAPKTRSSAELPSIGSALHNTGTCKPCAWFHKPQGCQNGRDCHHCHLCPSGEHKARRKARRSAETGATGAEVADLVIDVNDEHSMYSLQPPSVPCTPSTMQPPSMPCTPNSLLPPSVPCTPNATTLNLAMVSPPPGLGAPLSSIPSIGSKSHHKGECKPCAWFWKPQGCQNGQLCLHCHLCPRGEHKARRLAAKAGSTEQDSVINQTAVQQMECDSGLPLLGNSTRDRSDDRKNAIPQRADMYQLAPPPGLSELPALCPEFQSRGESEAVTRCVRNLPPLPQLQAMPPPPGLSGVEPRLPSIGSELHSIGECKPCAWFWKPQGCQNGQLCLHCHLCPAGEHKSRRKATKPARVPELQVAEVLGQELPELEDRARNPSSATLGSPKMVPFSINSTEFRASPPVSFIGRKGTYALREFQNVDTFRSTKSEPIYGRDGVAIAQDPSSQMTARPLKLLPLL